MTTQVRPLAGGAWNNASLTTGTKVSKKDTTYGVTLTTGLHHVAMRAVNQWVNCAGVGTAATLAQETAKAAGIQLQEV